MTHTTHIDKVAAIADFLRTAEPGLLSLRKNGVSHMMPLASDARRADAKVDLRALTEILEIDAEHETCSVEPGVTFAKLVRKTLEYGLIPKLVPELKTITVGGAVSGGSVESMSFRHGGLHDTAIAYECVTGTGEILECSRDQNPEIFEMLHGSYGTLGVLTRIDLQLTRALPFVRMSYPKFTRFEDFYAALLDVCASKEFDFVDAIIHGPDRFVLCLGTMVAGAPGSHGYGIGTDIFYKSTWRRSEDFIPIYDYFFRYDTDVHWLSRKIVGLENPIVRRLFGRFVLGSTRMLELANLFAPILQKGRLPDVVLDCFVPSSRFEEFYRFYESTLNFFPLWIVPYRIDRPYRFVSDEFAGRTSDQLFIDCAIYGKPNDRPGIDYYTVLEEHLFGLGALKALIARNTYSRERFWQIYSEERYSRAKAAADPTGRFRGLYEKVHCRI